MPWKKLFEFRPNASTTMPLTVHLIPRIDPGNRDDSLVDAEVWVRRGCDRLGLPWRAPWELGVVQVQDPRVNVQGYLGGRGHP